MNFFVSRKGFFHCENRFLIRLENKIDKVPEVGFDTSTGSVQAGSANDDKL